MKSLFHYTSLHAFLSIIKTQSFRFSDISKSNDFRELSYVWDKYNTTYNNKTLNYFHHLDDNKKYYALCLTQNKSSAYMYGIYNSDICIELDSRELVNYYKSIKKELNMIVSNGRLKNNYLMIEMKKMDYMDDNHLINEFLKYNNTNIIDFYIKLYNLSLWTKAKEWDREKETRLLIIENHDFYQGSFDYISNIINFGYDLYNNQFKSYYSCKFNKELIKGVILGPKCVLSVDDVKKTLNSFGYNVENINVRNYKNNNKELYKLSKDCYFRNYSDYGVLTLSGFCKDVIVDSNGILFLERMSNIPIDIKDIVLDIYIKLKNNNQNIEYHQLLNDGKELLNDLANQGFIVFGKNEDEISKKDTGFRYSKLNFMEQTNCNSDDNETQKFLDNYFYEKPHLTNFQFELTSKCNERCVHCYIPHNFKNNNITDELFYKTLNQLQDMNTLSVTLSGGEPMAHPNFKKYLREAKDKGFYVHILSNLVLLDDEIVHLMRDGNTVAVQVSLYSMNSLHHDAITTIKGSFEKTKEGILKLIEHDIPLQINCPVMKENKDDVRDVIKWGHDHKVRVNVDYAIMAEYNHETENLSHRLSPEECRKVIKDIIDEDSDYQKIFDGDNKIKIDEYKVEPNKPFCGVGFNTCCMVANGDVYPCPGWQSMVLGNLNEKSLKDIWENSEQLNKLRQLRRKDMPKCLNCEERAFCSPCLSRFANESKTGNPLEVAEHFCKVAKVNKEVVLDYIDKKRKGK